MKRCPECQFLYEDESTTCDMDGTPLRYTIKLPTLPGLAQSIWDKWTIAMLFAVVLVTVMVILYRATPEAAHTSASSARMTPGKNEQPAAGQDRPSADSAVSPAPSAEQPAADDSDGSTDARDPFESPANGAAPKSRKSKPGLPAEDEKEPTPAPVTHIQAATTSPAVNPATVASAAEIKSAETSASQKAVTKPASVTSNHPLPPSTYANKVNTQPQKKDSGFKSFFKKAGTVLKKPFGEN